jgi:hypothetical protein
MWDGIHCLLSFRNLRNALHNTAGERWAWEVTVYLLLSAVGSACVCIFWQHMNGARIGVFYIFDKEEKDATKMDIYTTTFYRCV